MSPLEFYYDVASPYTYLAATRVDEIGAQADVPVVWRPFLLGAVFKATGNAPPALVRARGMYMLRDLGRWSAKMEEPFRFPSAFPINSLLAQRCLTATPDAERPALSLALMRAYWADNQDLSDRQVLLDLVGAERIAAAETPENKAALRLATEEAVQRGAFGSPTFFVGSEMFFGNDRMDFVLDAAKRGAAQP